jgi:glycosyltransferase involved in cell wall biosynthesis
VLRGFGVLSRRSLRRHPILVILGDGTAAQRQSLRKWGREAAPGRVYYAGFRHDVERWLQAWDVFAHAPRLEAFGLVVAEAMATGLPVVACPVGGILDLLRHESTGILVPPNSPTQMADALQRLLEDDGLRTRMGERAHKIVCAEYGMDLYAQRYLQLYRDLQSDVLPQGVDGCTNGAALPESSEKILND